MKILIIMHLTTAKYQKASFLAHSVNIGTKISFFLFFAVLLSVFRGPYLSNNQTSYWHACPYVRLSDRHGCIVAKRCEIGPMLLLITNRKSPWMTLKGYYAIQYVNGAVLWLNGKSQRVGNSTIGQDNGHFLYGVNSYYVFICSGLDAIFN